MTDTENLNEAANSGLLQPRLVLPLLEGVLDLHKYRPIKSIHCKSPRCGDDHRDVMSGICKTETRIQNVTAIIEDMLWHHNGKRIRLTLEIFGENVKPEVRHG